jgi:hypothetical protein
VHSSLGRAVVLLLAVLGGVLLLGGLAGDSGVGLVVRGLVFICLYSVDLSLVSGWLASLVS